MMCSFYINYNFVVEIVILLLHVIHFPVFILSIYELNITRLFCYVCSPRFWDSYKVHACHYGGCILGDDQHTYLTCFTLEYAYFIPLIVSQRLAHCLAVNIENIRRYTTHISQKQLLNPLN